jgi:TetR/AcrR family acrAB operon transcriptional repressor
MCIFGHGVKVIEETNVVVNKKRESRILDAARELILRYGFDKTTVSDIARKAGISKGAIYLHYDSKEDLFAALIMRDVRQYADVTKERLEADPEEWSFVGMYRIALTILAEQPFMQALARNDHQVFGNFLLGRDIYQQLQNMSQRPLLLRKMQEVGAVRDDLNPEIVSYMMEFMGYGMWSIQDLIPPDQAPPIDDVIMLFADMLDRWLTPDDGGDKEAAKRIVMDMILEIL